MGHRPWRPGLRLSPREFLQLPLGVRARPVYRSTVAARVGGVGCGNRYRSSRRRSHRGSALGPGCSTALVAIYRWSARSGATSQTVQLGYVAWLVLMAGAVALLRACGRGRCRWEPAALVMLACAPPVWMPLRQFFHPQDIMATGLVLGALACVRRDRWVWAGVLVALALTSQQFALLVLVPLIVVVPQKFRARFVGATMATLALSGSPAVRHRIGHAFRAMVLGKSDSTVVGRMLGLETHVPLGVLVVLARGLPIILSATVAWCALRRLGPAVRRAVGVVVARGDIVQPSPRLSR